LVNGKQAPLVGGSQLDYVAGTGYTSDPVNYSWLSLPFSQTYSSETAHSMYVAGMPITSGIVNLTLTTPSAASDWTLHVSYVYNSVIVFSQGTAEFAF
jgi:hypothetical protein